MRNTQFVMNKTVFKILHESKKKKKKHQKPTSVYFQLKKASETF